MLDHQEHYNSNGVETKDIIEIISIQLGDKINGYQGFCIGNVIKYLTRFPFKGNPLDDLEKAKTYLDYLIESVKGNTEWR